MPKTKLRRDFMQMLLGLILHPSWDLQDGISFIRDMASLRTDDLTVKKLDV